MYNKLTLSFDVASEQLDKVVSAYEDALFELYPRPRYVVGLDAKILIPLSLLPDFVMDSILNIMESKPAVARKKDEQDKVKTDNHKQS